LRVDYFDSSNQGSFVIPPVIFDASQFENSPLGGTQEEFSTAGYERPRHTCCLSVELANSQHRGFDSATLPSSRTTASYNTLQTRNSLLSRDIQVPLYHAPGQPHPMPPPPLQAPSQTGSNDSEPQLSTPASVSSSRSPAATQATSVPTPSGTQSSSIRDSIGGVVASDQQRQNYERLRHRIAAMEAEAEEIYDRTREGIRSVDRILEDVLSSDGLPNDAFEKLKRASETLTSMKKGLR